MDGLDQVIVEGLEVTCIIGCGAPERVSPQKILVHLTLYLDTSLCGRTDGLEHTVNYAALSKRVALVCTGSQSFTLEHLCPLVARECLFGPASGGGMARRVKVRIEKPEALKRAKWPAVEIVRTREFFLEEDARWGPPRAPGIPAPLPTPSPGTPTTALLCLGSNVGNRARNLRTALRLLAGAPLDGSSSSISSTLPTGTTLKVEATSFLYQTQPMYVTDQPPFLNAAALVSTTLTPHQLLQHIKEGVEGAMGRPTPGTSTYIKNGPRCIDVDIALWGGGVVVNDGEVLQIPHPRLGEREFALRPLADIAPHYLHPVLNVTMAQLLARLPGGGQGVEDAVSPSGIQRVLAFPGWVGGGEGEERGNSWGGEEVILPLGSKTYIMGILNVTPDSFSDGGEYFGGEEGVKRAVDRAIQMVAEGVDIIDIGGQSTRPGAPVLSAEEEYKRTIPIIKSVRAAVGGQAVISVDTFYGSVAEGAVRWGANMVNDVTGGGGDASGMRAFLASSPGVPFVLMHSRGNSEEGISGGSTVYSPPPIPGHPLGEAVAVVEHVRGWLGERAGALEAHVGVPRWDIILDPGLGFSKTPLHSRALLKRGRKEGGLPPGYATLYGPSRKGFLSPTPTAAGGGGAGGGGGSPSPSSSSASASASASLPKDRVWGTAAAVTAAVCGGADFVRVHDVKDMVQVVATADAIYR